MSILNDAVCYLASSPPCLLGIVVGFLERERVVTEAAGDIDIVVVKYGRQSVPLHVGVGPCNGTPPSTGPHRPAMG